jgi:hypothetical protein
VTIIARVVWNGVIKQAVPTDGPHHVFVFSAIKHARHYSIQTGNVGHHITKYMSLCHWLVKATNLMICL